MATIYCKAVWWANYFFSNSALPRSKNSSFEQTLFHLNPRLNSASQSRSKFALQMLTNVSVAFVYKEANFKSETISQTYLGESLDVLDELPDWIRVRQEDGYEGWVARFFVNEKPIDWDDQDFYFNRAQIAWIYEDSDSQASTIRDITLLSKLPLLEKHAGWVKLRLPDETMGWLPDNPREPELRMDKDQLIKSAYSFLGVPYFWGGKTPKGFDCSGFVQSVYWLHGMKLPRDAYMQAEIGQRVDDEFHTWQAGDLIFFSERGDTITHVAISMGNGDFIHASGFVKINSLNPNHLDYFNEKYADIFTRTMRII